MMFSERSEISDETEGSLLLPTASSDEEEAFCFLKNNPLSFRKKFLIGSNTEKKPWMTFFQRFPVSSVRQEDDEYEESLQAI